MTFTPEFSRVIEINEDILDKKMNISAKEKELSKLAGRFGLHSIKFINIEYIISKKDSIKGSYNLTCSLRSEVVMFMIEHTEETMTLDENFDIILIAEDSLKKHEEILKEEDIEIIDPEEPKIDIGEVSAQYLSLFVHM